MTQDKKTIQKFQQEIWSYYKKNKRDFEWRNTHNSYNILVSEVMLQQTQTKRVESKYKEFLEKFPKIDILARAKTEDVLRVWQGLGYNRRALNLKKIAEEVVEKYKGIIPKEKEELMQFKGIGEGTAGAMRAFAFDIPSVFIETNIRRVFIYFFFKNKKEIKDDEIKKMISTTVDKKNPREWYYALMDYGAMLGVKEKENPNWRSRGYMKQSKFKGSDRELRGNILKLLIKKKKITIEEIKKETKKEEKKIKEIITQLEKEGFVIQKQKKIQFQKK